jgi:8-oxo-dGTP pyrophosphatase MutT (NUDIX family)
VGSSERIRKAATVIAARDGRDGVEVVVVRRSASSRFLAGYVVFPGGAVDPDDVGLAKRWFGTLGEAPRAAAIRELAEEAGLAITGGGVQAASDAQVGDRPVAPLAHPRLGLVDASPPAPAHLPQIGHWVAPDDVSVRFDARYFAVAVTDPVLRPVADGSEASESWWANPRELLARWSRGEERLYWPTMKTMEAIAGCSSVKQLLELHIAQLDPEPGDEARMPRATFYEGP